MTGQTSPLSEKGSPLLAIPTDEHTRELYAAWPKFKEAWGRKARKRWAESLAYILEQTYPREAHFRVWKTAVEESMRLP